jgi:hypothetical protein
MVFMCFSTFALVEGLVISSKQTSERELLFSGRSLRELVSFTILGAWDVHYSEAPEVFFHGSRGFQVFN